VLGGLAIALAAQDWVAPKLEAATRDYVATHGLKLGQAAQPLRAALTGRTVSPPIFEMLQILGKEECLARISAFAA
jgi:glutamyl-tRNA synthetase